MPQAKPLRLVICGGCRWGSAIDVNLDNGVPASFDAPLLGFEDVIGVGEENVLHVAIASRSTSSQMSVKSSSGAFFGGSRITWGGPQSSFSMLINTVPLACERRLVMAPGQLAQRHWLCTGNFPTPEY